MICKRITVIGKVQGVYFRASAQEKALELSLTGEVRNLPDGNVEVIACGSSDGVQRLIDWCHEGPPRAQVERVLVEDTEVRGFDGFRITRR
ncbi:MAG TPA: acylphosphatase [Chitinophagaceae bacterium]